MLFACLTGDCRSVSIPVNDTSAIESVHSQMSDFLWIKLNPDEDWPNIAPPADTVVLFIFELLLLFFMRLAELNGVTAAISLKNKLIN
jgi:hypothetical protein